MVYCKIFFYDKLCSTYIKRIFKKYSFIEKGYIKIKSYNYQTNELILGNNDILEGIVLFFNPIFLDDILYELNNNNNKHISYNKYKYKIEIVKTYINSNIHEAFIIY
jgi:hypothetical protein